ncbi:hypothetical protein P8452_50562 [Trifolium repens]|nr:hypothetical protein P8452_50562 [Trifolium repens]
MLSGVRVPSAFCNLSVVCLFWLGVIRVYLAHLNRPSHKSSEDLLLFFEGKMEEEWSRPHVFFLAAIEESFGYID